MVGPDAGNNINLFYRCIGILKEGTRHFLRSFIEVGIETLVILIRHKACTGAELMRRCSNNRLVDQVCIKIILLRVISCHSKIRVLLMPESRQLQTETFIFLAGKHIPEFCKTLISPRVNSESIAVGCKLIL